MSCGRENMIMNKNGGVALILVIWVTIILIAIVAEFSYSMRTEIRITQNFKEEEEAYQLALAGIEYAKAEIRAVEVIQEVFVSEEGMLIFDRDVLEPVRTKKLGRGSFEYIITDEDGKLNINIATQDQLQYTFIESGLDADEAAAIADSIIDWRDTNDLHMLNGAEEDYYRDLDEPYSCKDGPFDSIEELLLVKGMTEEILYGSIVNEDEEKTYSGVVESLTVNGSKNINVNTAPMVVMEAVIGINAAENIILQRDAGPVSEITGNGKLTSEFFTIISKGTNADGSIKRLVKAVVHNRSDKMEIIYWNDNFIR
ncbi:MAG: general secretion pathway protein GspK [Nitrospira sp.]|nr:general secretion pathway protein GspK [Nitrospira sp.]